ncbi:NAD-dependent epimerase [Acrocarpospora phusangensis]|uniref:NAD-dependent epimerase n=1 Tax=Acrocarpospora phusangensis TaxID=1070424 RepID=A0A919UPX4_9ACTN|nr:NAD-dependent epimerase/dehydratase family protein [Acrocarpospora phusangensis]GIH29254.1 NAD-dependent epimerase [Acrocarpospora phusangensis]
MGKHVVIGAGQVGRQLAELLHQQGHEVVQVTRSGSGADQATKIAADASDHTALARAAAGADVLYNCVNPRYHRWTTDWPPMADAMLRTAESTGAVYVILGNLYSYGPVDGPMTEDLPLASRGVKGRVRAEMWRQALAAHEAGRVRTTEIRASDYFGPGSTDQGFLSPYVIQPAAAGKRVTVLSDPDIPRAWTYLPDVARTLAIAGTDERAWGRPWHVPTLPAMSARTVAERTAFLAGARKPRVMEVPYWLIKALGLVQPFMRELRETRYQFDRPFVLDSSAFQRTFGLTPTPLDEALKESYIRP